MVPPPADGRELLSVEDDLTHNIRECTVIINAGVTIYFFSNPHVKALLIGLDDCHCPTYWLKNMCTIRCINYLLTKDIYLFMTENFLKYKTSFVASTSDFWRDRVFKNYFGEFIGNFIANRYKFNNGLSIIVFDTIIKSFYKYALRPPNPTLACCQALIDF